MALDPATVDPASIDIPRDDAEAVAYGILRELVYAGASLVVDDRPRAVRLKEGATPLLVGAARSGLRQLAADRTARIDGGQVKIPESFNDEDGDRWFVIGHHVTPEAMVLAVLVEQATNIGNTEAIELVVGLDTELDIDGTPVAGDKAGTTNSLLTRVTHRWAVDVLPEHERFEFVEPGTEFAFPVTVLAL